MNGRALASASLAVLSWSTVATAFKLALEHLTHFELFAHRELYGAADIHFGDYSAAQMGAVAATGKGDAGRITLCWDC